MDELNHLILAKLSGVTHTFANYDKVVHETQEQQGHYAEDLVPTICRCAGFFRLLTALNRAGVSTRFGCVGFFGF